jgi:hypothetical protein
VVPYPTGIFSDDMAVADEDESSFPLWQSFSLQEISDMPFSEWQAKLDMTFEMILTPLSTPLSPAAQEFISSLGVSAPTTMDIVVLGNCGHLLTNLARFDIPPIGIAFKDLTISVPNRGG